jgi:hypothetical protein
MRAAEHGHLVTVEALLLQLGAVVDHKNTVRTLSLKANE